LAPKLGAGADYVLCFMALPTLRFCQRTSELALKHFRKFDTFLFKELEFIQQQYGQKWHLLKNFIVHIPPPIPNFIKIHPIFS
jgi:hypothetical protein